MIQERGEVRETKIAWKMPTLNPHWIRRDFPLSVGLLNASFSKAPCFPEGEMIYFWESLSGDFFVWGNVSERPHNNSHRNIFLSETSWAPWAIPMLIIFLRGWEAQTTIHSPAVRTHKKNHNNCDPLFFAPHQSRQRAGKPIQVVFGPSLFFPFSLICLDAFTFRYYAVPFLFFVFFSAFFFLCLDNEWFWKSDSTAKRPTTRIQTGGLWITDPASYHYAFLLTLTGLAIASHPPGGLPGQKQSITFWPPLSTDRHWPWLINLVESREIQGDKMQR